MPETTVNPIEPDLFRHELTSQLVALLPGLQGAEPADLERAAAVLLVMFEDPDAPPELAEACTGAFDVLARESHAAGLLTALSKLAREPIAGRARAVLSSTGGAPTPAVGELEVTEARLARGEHADVALARLERPADPHVQVAAFSVSHDGWLADGFLTPAAPPAEAEAMLDDLPDFEPLSQAALADLLRAALERSAGEDLEMPFEAAVALPVVARALSGDAAGLPRLPAAPPAHPLDVNPAEDEEGFEVVVDELLRSFDEAVLDSLAQDSALARAGTFICGALLDWKGCYGDGRLGHWTADDLAEFLLHHYPRKVSADEETLAVTPEAVAAFIGHLDDEGLLEGEPPAQLKRACAELQPEFERRARDRSNFGPSKALLTQMEAEGVEPTCQEDLDAWLADFNARPRAERDRVLGPSLPAPEARSHSGGHGGRAPAARQAQERPGGTQAQSPALSRARALILAE